MIVSWQILQQFVDLFAVTPEEAAERLTMAGAEVERIERPGSKIGGVVAARITSLKKHPTRENLFVAELDTGTGSALCVTAATNLTDGDRVFYGPPGATLPDGVTLGVRDFDGMSSAGMMLSAAELGLPEVDIVEGILVLPEDAPIGADARSLYGFGDTLLDVSITPNRGDLLSVLGMARELKGLFPDSVLRPLPWEKSDGEEEWPVEFGKISLPDPGCLAYHLGLATNVAIAPSPVEFRVALTHMGMRPISNIVDVTNYVMLVLGQPLHAFDLNTLPGREVTVRSASDGESIVTLDGKERVLTPKDMLITSGGEPIALAGVMGGDRTGIGDDTTVVALEGAAFSALRVGHTSRRLGIASEAAFRYSRSVDPTLSATGVDCALSLMKAWSGASIGYRKKSATNALPEIRPVTLTKRKLQTYLLWSDMDESTKILEGFGIRQDTAASASVESRTFVPPTWRPDVAIEEDLIEEIGRYRGYNDALDLLPGLLPRRGDLGAPTKLGSALRDCALNRGYVEAITYSFLPESFVKVLHLPDDDPRAHPLLLANPISQDWIAMRTTLLPGLLNGLKESAASGWRAPVRLFEIGRVFLRASEKKEDHGHTEHDTLAALIFNGTDPRTPWADTADDLLSVRADVEALLRTRGFEPAFARGSEPFGHAGQTADVLVGGEKIGCLARLKPAIERELAFPGPVYVFELRISSIEIPQKPLFRPASSFPATFRDVSMLVGNEKTQDEVLAEIRAAAGDLLESVKLFDIYAGRGIPEGYRSMAFSLCYRAFDRTLNDEEIDKIHNSVRDTLTQRGYNMR
ncbi:MAG: phenylalanine--tRNA ligase subunit beta [Synergistaceae bacterium]|jgi:phenylalanyl-tRNA synthetase beta chain|nr:phenylalanine--tRNA ligase subunit beta [Synergistaceae bacterium]